MSDQISNDENKRKAAADNRANQLNPMHPAYWRSRGEEPPPRAPQSPPTKPAQR